MRVAGSTLVHASWPLERALTGIEALGFRHVEIDLFPWAHLDPAFAVEHEQAVADRIGRACEIAALTPVALSLGLHGPLDEQIIQLEACSRIARQLEISHLTFQASAKETPLDRDLARAREFVAVAERHGLSISIETHFFVHTEDPRIALRYVQEVPGLKLTLDPSHYEAGPHRDLGYHSLLPYVQFVHVRAAGRGGWPEIQQPAGAGSIDYRQLFASLFKFGFEGDASIEYVEGAPGVANASEEAKLMLELLRSALSSVL